MNIKANRDLIILVILIPLFLWSAMFISSRMDDYLPSHSVVNKSGTGCSVFFEALKELGYPVERTLKEAHSHDTGSIQVVVHGGGFDVNGEEIKSWVEKGGILVYLTPGGIDWIDYGTDRQVKGEVTTYKYHEGMILVCDASLVTNKTLAKNRGGAFELLKEIDGLPYKKLYFNEAHLFSAAGKPSLWEVIPIELKFLLYQMLIVLAAFFYYRGKRFGKPLPLYEEVERSENEYLYSAASLYRQAKCWDLMLENYYKSFLKEIHSSHEDWLGYWERENLPNLKDARKVYEFMHRTETKRGAKDYTQMVTILDQLKNILNKRRELYWRTLKKPL